MAEEQSNGIVRELRRIRFVLTGILLLLALHFAQVSIHRWEDSHYRITPRSQQLRDSQSERRAGHNEPGNRRSQPPPAVIPGEEEAAPTGNQGG